MKKWNLYGWIAAVALSGVLFLTGLPGEAKAQEVCETELEHEIQEQTQLEEQTEAETPEQTQSEEQTEAETQEQTQSEMQTETEAQEYMQYETETGLEAVSQPACRPMISTIVTEGILYTELSRMISCMVVATYFAAEPKPGVWSVMHKSLSIVLGMPMTFTSRSISLK